MAYTLRIVFNLGPAYADLLADLSVLLVDDDGDTVATVTTGFRDCGDGAMGVYSWKYAAFPDGFRGEADLYVGGEYVGVSASINPEEVETPTAAETAAAVVSALTAAGVLDVSTLGGQQVIEAFVGEDTDYVVVLDEAPGGSPTFTFTLTDTLEDALAGTPTVLNADITLAGSTITVDAGDIETADLEAGTYWHCLRRTDEGNRAVLKWGEWVVVGG
jgi:hypothetical protein